MPKKDHVGVCLPPAERNEAVKVWVEDGVVRISARAPLSVALSEPECRGLICELSARWSEAYEGVHV